jgi:hypothetical protein
MRAKDLCRRTCNATRSVLRASSTRSAAAIDRSGGGGGTPARRE